MQQFNLFKIILMKWIQQKYEISFDFIEFFFFFLANAMEMGICIACFRRVVYLKEILNNNAALEHVSKRCTTAKLTGFLVGKEPLKLEKIRLRDLHSNTTVLNKLGILLFGNAWSMIPTYEESLDNVTEAKYCESMTLTGLVNEVEAKVELILARFKTQIHPHDL